MIIEVCMVCATLIILAGMLFMYYYSRPDPVSDNSQEVAELRAIVDAQAEEIKKINTRITKGVLARVF